MTGSYVEGSQYFKCGLREKNQNLTSREHRPCPAHLAVPGDVRPPAPARRAAGAARSTLTRPGSEHGPADATPRDTPDTCGLALVGPHHRPLLRDTEPPCAAHNAPRGHRLPINRHLASRIR
ncbi:hypothetical protein RR46_07944 [Papilio xuthus]|uniref:Uncharacterized protein n=1 Tax=Papilio xuthus TaxID=66420 RepID=A0A194QGX1_PAPXU|nr:hypothetical protein RR46_07944 [Papilio xuthus]